MVEKSCKSGVLVLINAENFTGPGVPVWLGGRGRDSVFSTCHGLHLLSCQHSKEIGLFLYVKTGEFKKIDKMVRWIN